jgi:hypothetical protein
VSESNAIVLGGTGPFAVNVGIGTHTPQATPNVAGSGNFSENLNVAGNLT